jgi:hypothetical protein
MMSSLRCERVTSIDLRFVEGEWDFANRERAVIDAAWRKRVQANPSLWNGEVLVARDVCLVDGELSAEHCKTDYASFVVWRDLGWPDKTAFNIFGMGVVVTADGALVYGEMGAHTLNAGAIYPPGGSLEPKDVMPDGSVGIDHSIAEELAEEIGFDVSGCLRGEQYAVFDHQRIAVVQSYFSEMTFAQMEANFRLYIADEAQPELSRLVAVRSVVDISDAMPEWAKAAARLYLQHK